MTPAISIKGVTKEFRIAGSRRRVRAVDKLTLTVDTQTVFGLLGPNGSGKSTTIKMALGLLRPTSGSCEALGRPCVDPATRTGIGYLPEAPYFQRFLTGRELLGYFGKLAGVARDKLPKRIESLLDRVGLSDAGDRRVGGYSKGMLQRIGLAQALIGDPELVILDEPTAGVDPVGASDIAAIIRELKANGKTVVLCSHLLSQVETLCDRVGILVKGRLLLEGPIDALTESPDTSSLRIDGIGDDARRRIEGLAKETGCRISTPRRSLEEIFLELSAKNGDA